MTNTQSNAFFAFRVSFEQLKNSFWNNNNSFSYKPFQNPYVSFSPKFKTLTLISLSIFSISQSWAMRLFKNLHHQSSLVDSKLCWINVVKKILGWEIRNLQQKKLFRFTSFCCLNSRVMLNLSLLILLSLLNNIVIMLKESLLLFATVLLRFLFFTPPFVKFHTIVQIKSYCCFHCCEFNCCLFHSSICFLLYEFSLLQFHRKKFRFFVHFILWVSQFWWFFIYL